MRLQRLVVSVLLIVPGLFAQAQYGSIGGRAADSSGAVIPGLTIAVTNAETGQSARVVSGPDGSFLVPQLLPGTYEIRVEHSGFKRLQVSGIRVEINQNVAQDLTLEVGAVTESVTVQSTAAMVDTVSGSVGHVVENKEILELPLNGRNVFEVCEQSLETWHFRVRPCPEEAELARSWAAAAARKWKNEKNGSNGAGWMYNRS